jgi:hypothetical protein
VSKRTGKGDGGGIVLDTDSLQVVERVAYNIRQEVIVVTRDKVELCLSKHVSMMEQRRLWLVFFGICLACVAALVSSTFRDAFGIKADAWFAMFALVGAGSGLATLFFLVTRGRAKTVHQLIDELKAESPQAIAVEERETIVTSTSSVVTSEQRRLEELPPGNSQ